MTGDARSQTVVITGMHRSGTSLVSSLLQSAGVDVGEQLLAPNTCNPRGFFEDVEFLEFHESLLRERGQSYLFFDEDFSFVPTVGDTERAQQLISARSDRRLWGWKDPRTSLFLPFWHQQLPHACYLFVYRNPLDVLLSLVRRGEFDNHLLPIAGFDAWWRYNANIKAFCDQFPNRCLLAHIDGVVDQPQRFARLLKEKLGLDCHLELNKFTEIYHGSELAKASHPGDVTALVAKLFPAQFELYDQLNACADLQSDTKKSSAAAVPNLQSLAGFVEELPKPTTMSLRHSLLQLLLTKVAPQDSERTLDRFYCNAKSAQVSVEHLWLPVQQLERIDAAPSKKPQTAAQEPHLQLRPQEEVVQAQTIQLGEQHRMLQEQKREIDRQAGEIQALLAESNRVPEKRTWRLFPSYLRRDKNKSRRVA